MTKITFPDGSFAKINFISQPDKNYKMFISRFGANGYYKSWLSGERIVSEEYKNNVELQGKNY